MRFRHVIGLGHTSCSCILSLRFMVCCNSFSVFAFAFTPFSFAHSRLYSLILLLLSHPSLSQLSSSRPFFLIPSPSLSFLLASLSSCHRRFLGFFPPPFPEASPPLRPLLEWGGGGAPKGTIRRRRARLGGPRDRSWRFPLVNSAEYGPLPRPALRGGLSCPPLYLRMYDRGIKTRHAPAPRHR